MTRLWSAKPWWCQPWSLVLTGTALSLGSWVALHRLWVSGLVGLAVWFSLVVIDDRDPIFGRNLVAILADELQLYRPASFLQNLLHDIVDAPPSETLSTVVKLTRALKSRDLDEFFSKRVILLLGKAPARSSFFQPGQAFL